MNLSKTGIQATNFCRPNGKKEILTVFNVFEGDAEFINRNNIKVSMEDLGTDYVIWLDDGTLSEDGTEPDEVTIIAAGRTCQDCLKRGVELVRKRKPSMI